LLDRVRHAVEAGFGIVAFEDMDFNEWHYLVSADQEILELKNQHLLQPTTAGLTRKKEESELITNTVADVAQACFSQVQTPLSCCTAVRPVIKKAIWRPQVSR